MFEFLTNPLLDMSSIAPTKDKPERAPRFQAIPMIRPVLYVLSALSPLYVLYICKPKLASIYISQWFVLYK
jgi:hypothetical protein